MPQTFMIYNIIAEGISKEAMQDLCLREADAPIFATLVLNYGQTIKFQKECQIILLNMHGGIHLFPTIKYKLQCFPRRRRKSTLQDTFLYKQSIPLILSSEDT